MLDDYFNQLVLNKIYTNLSLTDLKNCSLVNKKFKKAFDNDTLWKFLFDQHYGKVNIDILQNTYATNNYKIIYQNYKNILFIKNFLHMNEEINVLITLANLDLSNNLLAGKYLEK